MKTHFASILFSLVVGPALALAGETYVSHPPMRPLPVASQRPLEKGKNFFVDPAKGDDAAVGSQEAPWKTLARGVKDLQPGDTLVLRGGTYYETLDTKLSGAANAPITLRAFPGEVVTIDGGFREFLETPEKAWEPYPAGAPGEYRSVKAYNVLRNNGRQPRHGVFVLGNFADSMVPLMGYFNVLDLRCDSMLANLDNSMTAAQGIYCGPGLWFDARPLAERYYGSFKIHIRLAPTSLDYLGKENNYHGETDPRKVPMVIGGPLPVININGAHDLRLQDLVLRGSSVTTLEIASSQNVELDGLTVYGGAPAMHFVGTNGLRVMNSAFRGVSAPWSSRYAEKYRGISTYVMSTSGGGDEDEDAKPSQNHDVEIGYCEFTDNHDGLALLGIQSMKFHHNLVEHFNDDGIEPGPKQKETQIQIYNNRIAGNNLTLSLHGGKTAPQPLEGTPGSGLYIYRNIFDLRPPIHSAPPRKADDKPSYGPTGVLCTDHGSPLWPTYYFYQNTVISQTPVARNFFLMGMGSMGLTYNQRNVFNNIFAEIEGVPAVAFYANKDPGDLHEGGNLLWGVNDGPAAKENPLEKFRASAMFKTSQEHYPAGWTTQDVFADPKLASLPTDPTQPVDARPQSGSPAIDAGQPIPSNWPDSLRDKDAAKPDIGALPAGVEAFHVGVNGRYTCFGQPAAK